VDYDNIIKSKIFVSKKISALNKELGSKEYGVENNGEPPKLELRHTEQSDKDDFRQELQDIKHMKQAEDPDEVDRKNNLEQRDSAQSEYSMPPNYHPSTMYIYSLFNH
jgi:hypothetical protein